MSRHSDVSDGTRKGLIIALVIAAIVIAFFWWLFGVYLDNWHIITRSVGQHFVARQFVPSWNPLQWTPWAYLCTAIAAVIVGCIAGFSDGERWRWSKKTLTSLVLALGLLCMYVPSLWDNDKDAANWYNSATTFYVEDTDELPTSLEPVIDEAQPSNGDCAYNTNHDIPSCIAEGILPDTWEQRTSSVTGAEIVMKRTSDSAPNTTLMSETMTYRNDTDVWTAIRNGKNKQPIYGIVEWNGAENATTCRFKDEYALDYSFGGKWGQNLTNIVADKYPTLLYEASDMWGYCKGDEPVIVIPVTDEISYNHRTVQQAVGVLEITGSSSGEPAIKHVTEIKAGDYPGPVYPASLVAKQREEVMWAAGRAHKNRLKFGYEPLEVASQAGNLSEYLLEDESGNLFWVTPLKARSSDSQQVVAYSITSADTVASEGLNEQRIYVLPDGDPRIVNLDEMATRVETAIKEKNEGFYTGSNPGSVTEFLPVNATTWQAYAELNGRVVYRIVISTDARVSPEVENIDEAGNVEEQPAEDPSNNPDADPSEPGASCADPTILTEQELADCIARFTGELVGRSQD